MYARDRANLERVIAALRELERGFHFTFETNAGGVDLRGLPAGVDGYDELLPNAVEMKMHGHEVRVASLGDLIRMKVAAGRPKDRAAAEPLAALRKNWNDKVATRTRVR